MKESEIRNYYNKKIKELKKHNKLYFEKSSPKITDYQYDLIKKEIIDLEKKHIFLKSDFSPSNSLGYAPSKNFEKAFFLELFNLSGRYLRDKILSNSFW